MSRARTYNGRLRRLHLGSAKIKNDATVPLYQETHDPAIPLLLPVSLVPYVYVPFSLQTRLRQSNFQFINSSLVESSGLRGRFPRILAVGDTELVSIFLRGKSHDTQHNFRHDATRRRMSTTRRAMGNRVRCAAERETSCT